MTPCSPNGCNQTATWNRKLELKIESYGSSFLFQGALPKKIHPVKRPVKRLVKWTFVFSQHNLTVRFNQSFNWPYFFGGEPLDFNLEPKT